MASKALMDPGKLGAQLARLSDENARLAVLRRNPQLRDPAVVEFLYEEVVRLVRANVRQADRLAQAAHWIANKLADDFCRAQAWRAAGHVQMARGQYNDALRSYEKALVEG